MDLTYESVVKSRRGVFINENLRAPYGFIYVSNLLKISRYIETYPISSVDNVAFFQ